MDQTTISFAKKALMCANTMLAAGALYLVYERCTPTPIIAEQPVRQQIHIENPQQIPINPTTVTRLSPQAAEQTAAPVDPRLEQLTLREYPQYNTLIPAILDAADQTGVPQRILALTVLTESNRVQADRYEPGFQQQYIEPLFRPQHPNRRLQDTVQRMLHQQMEHLNVRDEAEFKRQLATSYGPAQIMYVTAIENGFNGTADELREPQQSILYAARRIRAHERSTHYDPERVLIDYNTGSIRGDPAQGHLTRGMRYWRMLQH